jgi:GntR family transcriptional regulator, transcriptional repressor for pyruvate dehydrogenase complex
MFKPVQKKSLSDAVFEQLRTEIISGRMEPGSTLPAERALCEALGVNRGAVREALKRLEQARLVSVQHGGSTTVLDYREHAGTDLLSALLITAEGRVNTRVARSVMEMRSALAPDIARLCAIRGRHLADAIDAIVEQMAYHRKDLGRLQILSLEFWSTLVEGSDNVAYQLALNSMREAYEKFAHLLTHVLADEFKDLEAYRAIADAIRNADPDEAEAIAREHIRPGEERIGKVIQTLESIDKFELT